MGASNWRSHRWWEVSPPIGGGTSNWRSHLQLEVPPLIRDVTSDWRSHLQLEVPPPIGGSTSDQRCHLQLEISPPIGGPTSWRYFFVPTGVITILDYIKNDQRCVQCNILITFYFHKCLSRMLIEHIKLFFVHDLPSEWSWILHEETLDSKHEVITMYSQHLVNPDLFLHTKCMCNTKVELEEKKRKESNSKFSKESEIRKEKKYILISHAYSYQLPQKYQHAWLPHHEGNRVVLGTVYWHSPLTIVQPCGKHVDLKTLQVFTYFCRNSRVFTGILGNLRVYKGFGNILWLLQVCWWKCQSFLLHFCENPSCTMVL